MRSPDRPAARRDLLTGGWQNQVPVHGQKAMDAYLPGDDPLAASRSVINGVLWGAILWALIFWVLF